MAKKPKKVLTAVEEARAEVKHCKKELAAHKVNKSAVLKFQKALDTFCKKYPKYVESMHISLGPIYGFEDTLSDYSADLEAAEDYLYSLLNPPAPPTRDEILDQIKALTAQL